MVKKTKDIKSKTTKKTIAKKETKKVFKNVNESETEVFKKKKLNTLFAFGAFISFSSAVITYVLSSYIVKFIDESLVGLVYLFSNVLSIIFIFNFGKIIKRFGIFRMCITNIVVLFLSLILQLFISKTIFNVILLIIIYQTASASIWMFIDYYVEKYSSDNTTGNTKGLQWTILNITFLFGPLVSGFLIAYFNFNSIFLVSAIAIVPVLFLLLSHFKNIKIVHEDHVKIDIKKIYKNKPIFKISVINFILNFFYYWMVVFTPIYMNKVLGLTWDKVGIISALILLPFVIFQYPAGKIADKYLGEKELLFLGILIMGLSTIGLFFTNSIWAFVGLLFCTRIGASIIEIMREVYLYKNLNAGNIDLISFYKIMSPFAWVVGPIISIFFLSFLI